MTLGHTDVGSGGGGAQDPPSRYSDSMYSIVIFGFHLVHPALVVAGKRGEACRSAELGLENMRRWQCSTGKGVEVAPGPIRLVRPDHLMVVTQGGELQSSSAHYTLCFGGGGWEESSSRDARQRMTVKPSCETVWLDLHDELHIYIKIGKYICVCRPSLRHSISGYNL